MPTTTFFSRISRLSLLVSAVTLGVGCAGRTPIPATAASPVAVATTSAAAPAPSVFDLQDFWYSQHVGAAKLSSLSGGLLVVGFIDTNCQDACVSTLNSMRKIERETDVGVHFVLVARPAAVGSPAALAAFANARHLSANRYTIISGNNKAVANLLGALDTRNAGVTVASLEESSMLSVLDFNGIVVQQRGYGVVGPVIEALTLLLNIR